MELIKLYDLGHLEHKFFDGLYEVGKLTYNCDNHRAPVVKRGRCKSYILRYLKLWFTQDKAELDLIGLGFEKLNEVEWIK